MKYDNRREAAARRTKYKVGDIVQAVATLPPGWHDKGWRKGTKASVLEVTRDAQRTISSSGILLKVLLSGRDGKWTRLACAWWWRKVTR